MNTGIFPNSMEKQESDLLRFGLEKLNFGLLHSRKNTTKKLLFLSVLKITIIVSISQLFIFFPDFHQIKRTKKKSVCILPMKILLCIQPSKQTSLTAALLPISKFVLDKNSSKMIQNLSYVIIYTKTQEFLFPFIAQGKIMQNHLEQIEKAIFDFLYIACITFNKFLKCFIRIFTLKLGRMAATL